MFKKLGINEEDSKYLISYKTTVDNPSLLNYSDDEVTKHIAVKARLKNEGEWVGVGMVLGAQTEIFDERGRKVKASSIDQSSIRNDAAAVNQYTSANGERLVQERVRGDGNCLFASLARVAGADTIHSTDEMRSQVVAWMETFLTENNVDLSQPVMDVVTTTSSDEVRLLLAGMIESRNSPTESLQDYVGAMKTSGTWGGSAEIFAASRLLGKSIQVYRGGQRSEIDLFVPPNSDGHVINLHYYANHYDALVVRDTSTTLTEVA